jgi:hypothetical protein
MEIVFTVGGVGFRARVELLRGAPERQSGGVLAWLARGEQPYGSAGFFVDEFRLVLRLAREDSSVPR